MKYLVINNSPEYGGGVERDVKEHLNNFSETFKKDLLLMCNDSTKANEFYFAGVRCINLKTYKNNFVDKIFHLSHLLYSYRLYRYFKDNIREQDVVVIHGNEYGFFLSLLRKKINVKFNYILSSHGSLFEAYTQQVVKNLPAKLFYVKFFFYFFRYYYYIIDKVSLKNIDSIVFISKTNKYYFEKTFKLKKITSKIIHNGFDLTERKFGKVKTYKTFTAIIIGSRVLAKGLDIAIKAVKDINQRGDSEIKLNVIGFDDFRHYYPESEKNINYLGRLKKTEVMNWFDKSDFLLFPSRYESFGNVIIECLISGKPFVVSHNCVHADFDYSKVGIVVDKPNDVLWKTSILEMMKPERYNKLLANIRNLDLAPYDTRIVAREYEKIMNSQH